MGPLERPVAPARFVVGIGASAGGVEALIRLVRGLPGDFPAAVVVVLHVPASSPTVLHQILGRQTELPVVLAEDGAPLEAGRIVVAVPDRHVLVAGGHVEVRPGPKENGVRPAVDPMLRSLAAEYGRGAAAVILSGALGDGAGGARAVAAAGGLVVVQAPDDATVPTMPQSTLLAVGGSAVALPAGAIGRELARLIDEHAEEKEVGMPDVEAPEGDPTRGRPPGPPTGLTCPECNGALWTVGEPDGHRYECRIGHAYSEDALVGAQGSRVEAALWTALEVLEERAELLERIAERHGTERPATARRMSAAVADTRRRAELLRDALAAGRGADTLSVDAEDLLE